MRGAFDLAQTIYISTATMGVLLYKEINDFVLPVISTNASSGTGSCGSSCFFGGMVLQVQ